MKISVNTALKQEDIIQLLDGQTLQEITFTFLEKKGMNLIFEVNTEDGDNAIKVAKATIKAAPFGSAILLTFNKL